jgi:hypothetical protein
MSSNLKSKLLSNFHMIDYDEMNKFTNKQSSTSDLVDRTYFKTEQGTSMTSFLLKQNLNQTTLNKITKKKINLTSDFLLKISKNFN